MSSKKRTSGSLTVTIGGKIPKEFDAPLLRPCFLGASACTVSTRLLSKADGTAYKPSIQGIARDPLSSDHFVTVAHRAIVRVSATNVVTLLAGTLEYKPGDVDGIGSAAKFQWPYGIVASIDGTMLFFSDRNAHKIKCLDLATGLVRTVAGSGATGHADGVGLAAQFSYPTGITISPDGRTLFILNGTFMDAHNSRVRQMDVLSGTVTTMSLFNVHIGNPESVVISPDGKTLYICGQRVLYSIDVATGAGMIFAGSGVKGSADGVGRAAQFFGSMEAAISPDGTSLFIADNGSHVLRQVDTATRNVTTIAGSWTAGIGDGAGLTAAQFRRPHAIVVSSDGATLTVASCSTDGLTVCNLRTVRVVPPPTAAPKLVIPPSTFAADFAQTAGNVTLPGGKITFIVGPAQRRIEHVPKTSLCARSEYFSRMFRSGLVEGMYLQNENDHKSGEERDTEQEIVVPDTTPEAFESLITYLLSDVVWVKPVENLQHAFDVIKLADKYDVQRLGLLVTKAMADAVCADTAVSFLEAAQTIGDARLFDQCRAWIAEKPKAMRESGGFEQLTDMGVAKGLLGDTMDEVIRVTDENLRLKDEVGRLKQKVREAEEENTRLSFQTTHQRRGSDDEEDGGGCNQQ